MHSVFFRVSGLLLLNIAVFLAHSRPASARPEYAARFGINRCTACHYSPAGGGPKNQAGKYFAAFGYPSNTWIHRQDYVGAEVKMLYYRPEQSDVGRGGLGIMAGNVWASVPIQDLGEDGPEVRLVAEENLGGFNAATARQWYARVANRPDTETSLLPQYVLVGRVIPPFGLMTDEHRTYVRIATNTEWNMNAFDTGVLASANPIESVHYDIGAFNGQKNAGAAPSAGMADVWGGLVNVRWTPSRLPFVLGASGALYSAPQVQASNIGPSDAKSIYGILSGHRLTHNRIPLTISAEWTQAKGFNSSIPATNLTDSAYAGTVAGATSQAVLVMAEYELTRRFSLIYKYDQLLLNQEFPADAYARNGFGFKHWFGNGMWASVRYDFSSSGRAGDVAGATTGDTSAAWAVLNLAM
jgi:hypothetical protein